MFFVYSVPNMNPAMGVAKDGKQAVSVYDRNLGNRRTVVTTPEEADAFVKVRKETIENASKRGLVDIPVVAVAGAGLGASIDAAYEYFNTTKLNKLATEANEALKAMQEAKPTEAIESLKYDLLHHNDKFKGHWAKLSDMFSEEAKEFKALNMTKELKKAGKSGAIIGAVTGLCLGLFAPAIRDENADKKLTAAFIENNKFEKAEEVDE